jgi:hypothetical protein
MAKLSLDAIASGFQAVTTLNTNFDSIETEFQDKVLYRNNPTGEANSMQNDLDMNGYNLLNVGNLSGLTTITGVAVIAFGTQRDGTGTHSLSAGDIYRVTEISASSSVTACISIAAESTSGIASGKWAEYIQKGAGPIKVIAGAGVTLRYPGTVRTKIQYGHVRAHYAGSDVWYLSGDLSAS